MWGFEGRKGEMVVLGGGNRRFAVEMKRSGFGCWLWGFSKWVLAGLDLQGLREVRDSETAFFEIGRERFRKSLKMGGMLAALKDLEGKFSK